MPPRAITQVCPQCEMPLVLPASFAGRTVACSRCGHAVLVESPEASPSPPGRIPAAPIVPPHLAGKIASPDPAPQPPAPKPPHLERPAKGEPGLSASANEPGDEASPAEEAPARSCLPSGCLLVVIALLSLGIVASLAVLVVKLAPRWLTPSVATDDKKPSPRDRIERKKYTNASRRASGFAGVAVRIDKVQVGRVDYRSKGEILQTATPNYLIINVNVKNKDREEPVEYHSWYDNTFEDDEGNRQDVELLDDNGLELKLFRVPGAENVERHSSSTSTLPRGDDVTDSLIFKLPDGYLDEPIPALYLKLPMVAFGQPGDFRFHIPIVMIDRRDK